MTGSEVSIVIPTYNRAGTLRRAVDSALSQTFRGPIEVVVVDNASQDATAAIMASYPSVNFHRWSENLGPLENWRRGVELSEGRWLKILWSDDWLEPNCVSELHSAVNSTGAVAATCRAIIHLPEGDLPSYGERQEIFDASAVVAAMLGQGFSLPCSPAAALVRRSDAVRGLAAVNAKSLCARKAIGPDVALLYWGVLNGGRGVHVPEPLVHFEGRGNDSITMTEKTGGGRLLQACYDSSLVDLASTAGLTLPPELMRLVRHRAAVAKMSGTSDEALHNPRLSIREGTRSVLKRMVTR